MQRNINAMHCLINKILLMIRKFFRSMKNNNNLLRIRSLEVKIKKIKKYLSIQLVAKRR